MKRKYQWMICAFLILLVVGAFLLLTKRDDQKLENGSFVMERTWDDDGLYQSRGQCLS